MAQRSKLDVKSAVRAAIKFLGDLGDFVTNDDVRLEETDFDQQGNWLITLSMLEPTERSGSLTSVINQLAPPKRGYKLFRIDATTGEVKSMKVRTLQPIE